MIMERLRDQKYWSIETGEELPLPHVLWFSSQADIDDLFDERSVWERQREKDEPWNVDELDEECGGEVG